MKQSFELQICAHVSIDPYNRSGSSVAAVIFTFVPDPHKITLEYTKIQMKMMLLVFHIRGRTDPFVKAFLVIRI